MQSLIKQIQSHPSIPWVYLPVDRIRPFLEMVANESTFLKYRLLKQELLEDTLDPKAILSLYHNHHYSFDEAERILDAIRFIDVNVSYTTPRLNGLKQLKMELITNNLLTPVDRRFLLNQTIFYPEDVLIPTYLQRYHPLEIHKNRTTKEALTVQTCLNAYEQAHAVIRCIDEWLMAGKDISTLKIINASETDRWLLQKEARFYGFSIQARIPHSFDHYPDGLALLKLAENESFKSVLESYVFVDDSLKNRLQSLIAPYPIEAFDHQEFLSYFLHYHHYPEPLLKNVVDCLSIEEWDDSEKNAYLFMNYCEPGVLAYHRDTDYLTDDEKHQLQQRTSEEENQWFKQSLKHKLETTSLLRVFSPMELDGKKTQFPDLFSSDKVILHAYQELASTIRYGVDYWRLTDAKRHYQRQHEFKNEPDISEYLGLFSEESDRYHPQFKVLSSKTAKRLIHRGFTFSATNLELFNACHFRFLLDYLLKITPTEPSLPLIIGNVSHAILARVFNNSESFDSCYKQAIEPYLPLKPSIRSQLDLYMERLKTVVDDLNVFLRQTQFQTLGREKQLSYVLPSDESFKMSGTIDWLLSYKTETNHHLVVIDYKTGNRDFDRSLFEKGLDIQPLFYLNLLTKQNSSSNDAFGFFYQPVTLPRIKRDLTDKFRKNALKLRGVCTDSVALYEAFSPDHSCLGIHVNASGTFKKNSRLLTTDEMTSLIDSIDKQIDQAIRHLNNGDYAISPVMGAHRFDDSPSCQYCPYHGICYSANVVTNETEPTEEDDDLD